MELEYLKLGVKILKISVFLFSDQNQNLRSLFVPFVITLVGTCPLAEVMNDVNNMEINFLRMHISLSSEMIVIILKQMFVRIASVLSVLCRIFCACTSFFLLLRESQKLFMTLPTKKQVNSPSIKPKSKCNW